MKPWVKRIDEQFLMFKGVGQPEESLRFNSTLLCWSDWSIRLVAPDGPSSFTYNDSASLFDARGGVPQEYGTLDSWRLRLQTPTFRGWHRFAIAKYPKIGPTPKPSSGMGVSCRYAKNRIAA
jgi:hypothetical protein